jgi:hypothetical protein
LFVFFISTSFLNVAVVGILVRLHIADVGISSCSVIPSCLFSLSISVRLHIADVAISSCYVIPSCLFSLSISVRLHVAVVGISYCS